jgi:hypothetical protein
MSTSLAARTKAYHSEFGLSTISSLLDLGAAGRSPFKGGQGHAVPDRSVQDAKAAGLQLLGSANRYKVHTMAALAGGDLVGRSANG